MKYKLLKEIELGVSLPIGSIIEIKGKYCTLDNDDKIPIDWLVAHGYLEPAKDKYEECAKEIEEYTIWGGSIRSCKIQEIIRKHFPEQEMVINLGGVVRDREGVKQALESQGFTIINE